MKKWYGSFFAGVLLVAALTGCGQSSNPASGGKGSSELTVYTALEDDQLKAYVGAFNTAHPEIKLNIVRDSTGVLIAKLIAEKDNPQADVVWGTAATELLGAEAQGMENLKLLVVQPIDWNDNEGGRTVIAADRIGAGFGEKVIVSSGTPARIIFLGKMVPIDAVIVGIVDSYEVTQET